MLRRGTLPRPNLGNSIMPRYAAGGGIWLVLCCLLAGPLVNRGFATAPAGYGLTWSDEFDGNSLDASKWYVHTDPRKDGVNDPAALSVGGGNLTISTFTGTDGLQHTGYLETYYQQKYGYFETRIEYQQRNGTDSGFWVYAPHVGAGNGAAIDGAEMDLCEHYNTYSSRNKVNQAVIWYDSNYNNLSQLTPNLGINNGQFHTFGVSWDPSGYKFYVDDTLTYTVTQSNSISMVPEFLILSTEVINADFTGYVPTGGYGSLGSASNSKMIVDYVRTYAPLPGDANLDGRVDALDLAILAANYRKHVTGGWAQADFNYDGVVDVKDLALLAANYRHSLASDAVPAYDGLDAEAIRALSLAGVTMIPEPGTLAMLAVALIGAVGVYLEEVKLTCDLPTCWEAYDVEKSEIRNQKSQIQSLHLS